MEEAAGEEAAVAVVGVEVVWGPEMAVTGEDPAVMAAGVKMRSFLSARVGEVVAGAPVVAKAEAAARVGGRRMENAVEMEIENTRGTKNCQKTTYRRCLC